MLDSWALLAMPNESDWEYMVPVVLAVVVVLLSIIAFLASRYKRCPSNRVLTIFGSVGADSAAKCLHGGGAFVWPIIQDHGFMSLEPITIEIDLEGALSLKNIRVNVPSTFTVGISTKPEIMQNAAERVFGLTEMQIGSQAQDIIIGQLRLVIATLTIEEINQDREKFLTLVNQNVNIELNKIGLEVINVNIRDITDESGYIEAIGKKAAAEAVNVARVDVARAEKDGATGEAREQREMRIIVAQESAQSIEGEKSAERDQRIAVARLEAEGVAGEASSEREKNVAIASESAKTQEGEKEAERNKRIAVSAFEAEAVDGENKAKANIAERNAALAEAEAEARRRAEVARAEASKAILEKEREMELARLEKEEIVQEEIDKRKLEISAEAEAEQKRRIARGEADATLARYNAEAEGTKAVLEAKAEGYNRLVEACAARPDIAPTLLMIEKLPELVKEQVKAISNLKIDKITVWDGGKGGSGKGNSTSDFLSGMISSLPAVHELAGQAGIKLPGFLGKVEDAEAVDAAEGAVKRERSGGSA